MILAIDANSHLYADWKAVGGSAGLTFVRRVGDMMAYLRPKGLARVVCAFDAGGETFRHKLYPDYKANREERPAEYTEQIGLASESLPADVKWVLCQGFEADDILATVAAGRADGEQVVLSSCDKDCRQCLVKGEVLILRSFASEWGQRTAEWYNADKLFEDHGLQPDQWVDFQCLCVDSADGVPGASNIGPKLAAHLLGSGATMDEVFEAARSGVKIKGCGPERVKAILEFESRYPLVKQLLTLRKDVPM